MKQGTLITKIIMFILFAGVALYLGVYILHSLSDPFSSAMAYQDTLDDTVEATGILVRDEQALSQGSSIMDILPDEGARVAANQEIAVLYQNNTALERKRELDQLITQRKQLELALNSGSSLSDAAKLEHEILSSILSLRAGAEGGDLSDVEADALSLRTQIMQREFVYSASGDTALVLAETILQLDEQISRLQTQSSADTTSIYAPCSGLFSGVSDGLEEVLTPEFLKSADVNQLKSYIGKQGSNREDSVGKLITGTRWYFATVVDSSVASRLQPGDSLTVAFSKDFTGEVSMKVERVDKVSEEGCVLVLSSDRHLKDVTMLRTQTVKLIFTRYTGIRVPKQALRMETFSQTNSETGVVTTTQRLGVYTVAGAQAEFNLVDIVREGSNYYLVAPSEDARTKAIAKNENGYYLYTALDPADLHIIRAGDEIIINASGLFNGKVVLE